MFNKIEHYFKGFEKRMDEDDKDYALRVLPYWITTLLLFIFILCCAPISVGCLITSYVVSTFLKWIQGNSLLTWWHSTFGKITFEIAIQILIFAKGNPIYILALLASISLMALQMFQIVVFGTINPTAQSIGGSLGKQTDYQNEDVNKKLKEILRDDTDNLTLYEKRISPPKSLKSYYRLVAVALIVWIFTAPMFFMFFIGIFNAMMRIFSSNDIIGQIDIFAPNLAVRASDFLPLPSIAYGINLEGRHLGLAILNGFLMFIIWAVQNASVIGYRLPKSITLVTEWVPILILSILSYIFLPGFLLIFILTCNILIILEIVFIRFVLNPLILRFTYRKRKTTSG